MSLNFSELFPKSYMRKCTPATMYHYLPADILWYSFNFVKVKKQNHLRYKYILITHYIPTCFSFTKSSYFAPFLHLACQTSSNMEQAPQLKSERDRS